MKEELTTLVGENRIKEAIAKLIEVSKDVENVNLRDDIILLASRYREFDRDRHRGFYKNDEAQVIHDNIKKAILDIVDQVPAKTGFSIPKALPFLLFFILMIGGGYLYLMPGDISANELPNRESINRDTCIQPFVDDTTFSILILPFSMGGDVASASNLASDLLLRLEQISEEEDIDFSLHYWKEFTSDGQLSRAEARSVIACTDADMLIYGGFWSSTKTDQGQLRIDFELHEEVREVFDFFGEQLKTLLKGQSTPFFASVAEIEEQFFTGELNDIARIEQLLYWLASVSKIAYDECATAERLATKAWSYDLANAELLNWKLLVQYFDENYTGILSDTEALPDSLQTDEVVFFRQLAWFAEEEWEELKNNLQYELSRDHLSFRARYAASLLLGVLVNTGNVKEALSTINTCEIVMHALPVELYWYKIQLLYQQEGMSPRLEGVLQARLEKDSDSFATHLFLAEYYTTQRNYNKALETYDVLLAQIDVDSAYHRVVGETPEAEWSWEIPTQAIYNAVGNVHFIQKNNVEATKYYRLALKYADAKEALGCQFNLALIQLQDKAQLSAFELDSIKQFLLDVIDTGLPSFVSGGHLQIASLYQHQQDHQAAIWHAEEAMCDGSNEKEALAILAFSLGNLGSQDRSYETWQRFLSFDPTTAQDYYKVGVNLGQQGSSAYAIKVFEDGMECALAQNDSSTYSNFLPAIGVHYLLQDSLMAAMKSFDDLLGLNPQVTEYAAAEILFGGILGMLDLSYAILSEYSVGSRRVYFSQNIEEIGGQLGAFFEFFLCISPPVDDPSQVQEDDDVAAFLALRHANVLICKGQLDEGKKILDDYLNTYHQANELSDLMTAYIQASYSFAKGDATAAVGVLDNAILQARNLPRLSLEELPSLIDGVPIASYVITMVYNQLYYAKMQIQAEIEDYEAVYNTALAAERDGVKNVHVRTTYLTLKETYE